MQIKRAGDMDINLDYFSHFLWISVHANAMPLIICTYILPSACFIKNDQINKYVKWKSDYK